MSTELTKAWTYERRSSQVFIDQNLSNIPCRCSSLNDWQLRNVDLRQNSEVHGWPIAFASLSLPSRFLNDSPFKRFSLLIELFHFCTAGPLRRFGEVASSSIASSSDDAVSGAATTAACGISLTSLTLFASSLGT